MTQYLNSIYMVIIYILQVFNKLHFCCLFVISSFRVASFRLFAWRYFVFSHSVFSPRKDEKMPCVWKRIGTPPLMLSYSILKVPIRFHTPREKTTKLKFQIASFRMAFFRLFALKFRLFEWRVSSFRLFAWRYFVFWHGVFSSFLFFAWRFLVFSRSIFSPRQDEKTKWHNPATIVLRCSYRRV